MEQPEVAEAAVAAQPDRVRGEIPVAYVVWNGSGDPGTLEMRCRENWHPSKSHGGLNPSRNCRATLGQGSEASAMPRILMITSEAAPFAKTGGLADVLGALPPALAKLGEEVAVVMPRYASHVPRGSTRISDGMRISVGPNVFTVGIDQVEREGVRYLFVRIAQPLYARPGSL